MRKVLNSFTRMVGCASNFRLVAERLEIFPVFFFSCVYQGFTAERLQDMTSFNLDFPQKMQD